MNSTPLDCRCFRIKIHLEIESTVGSNMSATCTLAKKVPLSLANLSNKAAKDRQRVELKILMELEMTFRKSSVFLVSGKNENPRWTEPSWCDQTCQNILNFIFSWYRRWPHGVVIIISMKVVFFLISLIAIKFIS